MMRGCVKLNITPLKARLSRKKFYFIESSSMFQRFVAVAVVFL